MINSAVKLGSEVNSAEEPNDTKILGAGYKRASVGKRITAEICEQGRCFLEVDQMKSFLGFRGFLTLLTASSVRYNQGRLDFKWLRKRFC